MKQWLSIILCCCVFQLAKGNQNELIFNAKPRVWHNGDYFRIMLTMRYWETIELKGKLGVIDDLMIKEFNYAISLKDALPVGNHVLGPYSLDFQGQTYVSKSLAVKVLPRPGIFRGVEVFFSQDSCSVGESIQLVVFDYQNKREQIHDIELIENDTRIAYSHGGNTRQTTDSTGKSIWIRMRYFTITYKETGTKTITSKDFKNLPKNKKLSANLQVRKIMSEQLGNPDKK